MSCYQDTIFPITQRAEIINPVILFRWDYSKSHFLPSTEVK